MIPSEGRGWVVGRTIVVVVVVVGCPGVLCGGVVGIVGVVGKGEKGAREKITKVRYVLGGR